MGSGCALEKDCSFHGVAKKWGKPHLKIDEITENRVHRYDEDQLKDKHPTQAFWELAA